MSLSSVKLYPVRAYPWAAFEFPGSTFPLVSFDLHDAFLNLDLPVGRELNFVGLKLSRSPLVASLLPHFVSLRLPLGAPSPPTLGGSLETDGPAEQAND